MRKLFKFSLLGFLCLCVLSLGRLTESVEEGFDVRTHLSSSTRYGDSVRHHGGGENIPEPPAGCVPIHINLVARHGTRGPTKRRILEINQLAKKIRSEFTRLSPHINDAQTTSEGEREEGGESGQPTGSFPQLPAWMEGYRSFWEGRKSGGELVGAGENELFELGGRLREKFPTIFGEDYHHVTYPIYATQVPRASASAVAFGLGLFHGNGSLGSGRHRSFSVITDSKEHDTRLYFHETCGAYRDSKKRAEPLVDRHLAEVHSLLVPVLKDRYGLNLTVEDVGALWLLCKQEAAVLGEVGRACALFTPEEVLLFEWADDVAIHYLKGYGDSLNYRMGVPLLEDVVAAMDAAVQSAKEGEVENSSGSKTVGEISDREEAEIMSKIDPVQKARLRFAHAETVIPFTCLLGLFKESKEEEKNVKSKGWSVSSLLGRLETHKRKGKKDAEEDKDGQEEDLSGLTVVERISRELPFPAPPRPPHGRVWKGSDVSPYGANTALVLYHCPKNPVSKKEKRKGVGEKGEKNEVDDEFRVLALHNERPVRLPACGGELFCPYSVFKEKVAGPHLEHTYESTCAVKPLTAKESQLVRTYNIFSDYFFWFWNLFLFFQKGPASEQVLIKDL